VWKRDSTVQLYAPDGLHPSVHASYLAALVMYATLYARSPIGLPSTLRLRNGATVSIPAQETATLQDMAAAVIE